MKIEELDERSRVIRLRIETLDDLLYLYLILDVGDLVRAETFRQVRVGRSVERGDRVRMELTLSVRKIGFHSFENVLRVTGVIVEGPERLAPRGHHHTITVKPGDEITLIKVRGVDWGYVRRVLERARRPRILALVIAVDSTSIASALYTDQGIKVLFTGELEAQSKRIGYSGRESVGRHVEELVEAIYKDYVSMSPDVVIIYGPGFFKERVRQLLIGLGVPPKKLKVVAGGIGGYEGVLEAMRNDDVQRYLSEISFLEDLKTVNNVLASDKSAFGVEEVKRAAELGAVKTLVISTRLIKGGDPVIMKIVRDVEKYGGEVRVVFEDSEAGRILGRLGGVVAELRFSIQRDVS